MWTHLCMLDLNCAETGGCGPPAGLFVDELIVSWTKASHSSQWFTLRLRQRCQNQIEEQHSSLRDAINQPIRADLHADINHPALKECSLSVHRLISGCVLLVTELIM